MVRVLRRFFAGEVAAQRVDLAGVAVEGRDEVA